MTPSPDSFLRRAIRAAALVLVGLCLVWILVLWLLGGLDTSVLHVRLTTHDPRRPALAGAMALVIYLLAGGRVWRPNPRQASAGRRWTVRMATLMVVLCGAWTVAALFPGRRVLDFPALGINTDDSWQLVTPGLVAIGVVLLLNGVTRTRDRISGWIRRADSRLLVGTIAAAVLAGGLNWGTYAAGGSDSYGYLSEVNLWSHGAPVVPQPWATQVPWPDAISSFAPLGYRPKGPDAIVPTYPAGLPFLMVAAQAVAGPCAVYWVTPILGAVFVLFTWLLGCRLGSSRAGVIAAWLVATSPPMLFQLIVPLTDVPVAAVWTVAWYLLLGPGVGSAVGAGLAAGFASLIRPNLAPLCGVFVLWKLYQIWRGPAGARGARVWQAIGLGGGLLPGAIAVAAINQHLYGSPLLTGYGPASVYFAWSHIPINLKNYWAWFLDAETPVAVLGFAALIWPMKRVWTHVPDRVVVAMGALFVFCLWAQYQAFMLFDAWWFIRFLLPTWPFILIGTARVLELGIRQGRPIVAIAVLVLVVGLGLRGLRSARDNGTFEGWMGEHKYATVGVLAGSSTEANSVILSMQHSGNVRYYGGRMTVRYEYMQAARIDQDMAWLGAHGAHPYAVLEDWEADGLRSTWAGTRTGDRLKGPPLVAYDGPSKTFIYDLLPGPQDALPTRVYVEDYMNPRCIPPAPLPALVLK